MARSTTALAGVVASSRVYVKIHHASDVVAGAAIGVGLAAVARRVWPQAAERRGMPRRLAPLGRA